MEQLIQQLEAGRAQAAAFLDLALAGDLQAATADSDDATSAAVNGLRREIERADQIIARLKALAQPGE